MNFSLVLCNEAENRFCGSVFIFRLLHKNSSRELSVITKKRTGDNAVRFEPTARTVFVQAVLLCLFQKFRQYLTEYPVLLIAEPFSYCIVVFVKSVYKQANTVSLSVRKPDKRNRSGLL